MDVLFTHESIKSYLDAEKIRKKEPKRKRHYKVEIICKN